MFIHEEMKKKKKKKGKMTGKACQILQLENENLLIEKITSYYIEVFYGIHKL